MSEAEDTYTLAQAANVLRLSEPQIIQLITEGVLAGAMDEGGRWRIPRQAVNDRLGNRLAVKRPRTYQGAPMTREADFYTPGEAASLLGLTEYTVLGLLTTGQLEGQQDEQARWWIPASTIDDAARRSSGTDAPPDPSAEETIAMAPVSSKPQASEETVELQAVAGPVPRTPSTDVEGEGRTETPSGEPGGSSDDREERTRPPSGDLGRSSVDEGWVTTKVAAEAIGVTPRTIRTYIHEGELEGKVEQEGINKRLLVSIASLDELRVRREKEGKFRTQSGSSSAREKGEVDVAEVIRDLTARLEKRAAEAASLRTRLELTAEAESTLKERVAKLEEELEAERSKGFWRRLFGG
jgi:excisionase family DNA binding protein